MAQIPNLENAPINLTAIRDKSREELLTILKNIDGKKCLVLDAQLGGFLSLIVTGSLLQEHGVEGHYLTEDPVQTECTKLVYLVRTQPELIKLICAHINNDVSKALQRSYYPFLKKKRSYYLYFVPRNTEACKKILEEEKVDRLVTYGEYPLYMVPLDEDVLSFEIDLCYRECAVDGVASSLWHIAKAIHNLEFSSGLIPNVRAKGRASTRVAEILNRMQEEKPVNSSDIGVPKIKTLILLDREVDMVTPMCTQVTYEGLLDELLHINNNLVEIDSSIMGQQEGKMKVPLNSSKKLFKEIRDLNFKVAGKILNQMANSVKQEQAEAQPMSKLRAFTDKLILYPELTIYTNLFAHLRKFTSKPSFLKRLDMERKIIESKSFESCLEYIEDMIYRQEPLVNVLRFLISFSVTNAGLPEKNFDHLSRELLHSYGFKHMATLNNLERAGLFKKQESKSNWLTVKRALKLVVEDPDTANPNDISYVFCGYAPLSIRLIQQAIRSGWSPIEELLKLLPGPHSETKRSGSATSPSFKTLPGATPNVDKVVDGRRSVVLVVFVGGVTFAEIAALRFLRSQARMPYDLIIGTTKIVNGSSLIETLF